MHANYRFINLLVINCIILKRFLKTNLEFPVLYIKLKSHHAHTISCFAYADIIFCDIFTPGRWPIFYAWLRSERQVNLYELIVHCILP